MIPLILLVFAFCLAVIAFFVSAPPENWKSRIFLIAFACYVAAELIMRGPGLLKG